MKKYVKLLLLFFLTLVIVGCNKTVEDKNYTIKFDSDSELTYDDVQIEKKQTISLPIPSKKGYKFLGWYPSKRFVEGTQVTEETIIGKDITLHAKWEPIKVTIKLDVNGGELQEEVSTSYNVYSVDSIKLPIVNKEDHIFLGWYVGNTKYENEASFLEDTTLVAKYIALSELESEYNVTLELNGGEFYDMFEPLDEKSLNDYQYKMMKNENLSDAVNKIHYQFITDFCDYHGFRYYRDDIKYNFFHYTYERLIGNTGFFSDVYYMSRWLWLIQYLEYVAEPQNKSSLRELYLNNYPEANNKYFYESAHIRAELAGFIDVDKYIYDDTYNQFESHTYTEEEILSIHNLFNIKTYEPGKETPILAPIRDGYIFCGWYDNPDFEGEVYWSIPNTWFGNITLYARWEEI